jgi:hypothetical protein
MHHQTTRPSSTKIEKNQPVPEYPEHLTVETDSPGIADQTVMSGEYADKNLHST